MSEPTWTTKEQIDKEAQISELKTELAALDVKVPRWGEATIKACPEAFAEVIDAAGTTRGDIIAKKETLRASLAALG